MQLPEQIRKMFVQEDFHKMSVEKLKQLRQATDEQSSLYQTDILELFYPRVRPHDESLQLFNTRVIGDIHPDRLSYTTPEAEPLVQELFVWTRSTEHLWLAAFAKGISSLGFLIAEEDMPELADTSSKMLDSISEQSSYPAIAENFIPHLVDVALANYQGGELISRPHILAYSHAVWWVMGHLRGLNKVKGPDKRSIDIWIRDVLADRALRGILEE